MSNERFQNKFNKFILSALIKQKLEKKSSNAIRCSKKDKSIIQMISYKNLTENQLSRKEETCEKPRNT
jgi:hypothetical protein